MRYVSVPVAALFLTTTCLAADERPRANRVIEGVKTTFPAKSIPEGVKVLRGVLESCHDISDGSVEYTADDLKKAREGDHVRFVFPRPLKVDVLGKKLEASEVVYAAKGVFWLVCGEEIVRCCKYTRDKWGPFWEWHRQPLPADSDL